MTDREKLIELIERARYCPNDFEEVGICEKCKWYPDDNCTVARIADTLLANGVTVQKRNGANNPPEDWKGEGGYLTNYYIYTTEFGTDIGNYMRPANKWFCMGIPCNVTHWLPLPEPPKEE